MRLELHLKTGSLLVYWYKNMILKTKMISKDYQLSAGGKHTGLLIIDTYIHTYILYLVMQVKKATNIAHVDLCLLFKHFQKTGVLHYCQPVIRSHSVIFSN